MQLNQVFIRSILKPRRPGSHKGQNGRVLVAGGSSTYYGSPALVAKAALRAGADLAYLLVPERIADVIASYSPDFIVCAYRGGRLNGSALPVFRRLVEKTDAMVIGNGITKEKGALRAAQKLASSWPKNKPLVIDADCIGSVYRPNSVYTPHVVEFKRLSGKMPAENIDKRAGQVRALAKKLNAVVLLKGKIDVISDGARVALNSTGNAGMTHGGTGDTLAGICGAFLARNHSSFNSACLSAYVNGSAGDLAYEEFGPGLLASDLIERIPEAVRKL